MEHRRLANQLLLFFLITLLFCTCTSIQENRFSENVSESGKRAAKESITWHAVLVAGSYSDGDQKIDNWDNALEGMLALLLKAGLSEDAIRMHSSNPQTIGELKEGITQAPAWKNRISGSINNFDFQDGDGLILHLTSHGLDNRGLYLESEEDFRNILTPGELDDILDSTEDIPVVIFLSACFSGDFLSGEENIAGENRLILTASAEDRGSFGCGAGSIMPEWDDSLLKVLKEVDADKTWEGIIASILEDIERKETDFSEDKKSHPQVYLPDPLHPGFQDLLHRFSLSGN
jgi:hypothetical protein